MAKKESYNEMLVSLEEIINNFENNELTLEDSMKEYEKGISLVNKLYKTLNSLEGKLSKIRDKEEVEIVSKDE